MEALKDLSREVVKEDKVQSIGAARSKVLELNRSRRRFNPMASRLADEWASRLEAIEERNQDLVENNAQLVAALERANSTLSRFEETLLMNRDLTASALGATEEILDRTKLIVSEKRPSTLSVPVATRVKGIANSPAGPNTGKDEVDRAIARLSTATHDHLVSHLRSLTDQLSQFATVSTVKPPTTARVVVDEEFGRPAAQAAVSHPATTQIEVLAYPFSTFSGITAFHKALKRVAGVDEVRVRGFDQGKLRLAVECSSAPTVSDILAEARPEIRQSGSLDSDDIEVVVTSR